jgi:hypothetical protein
MASLAEHHRKNQERRRSQAARSVDLAAPSAKVVDDFIGMLRQGFRIVKSVFVALCLLVGTCAPTLAWQLFGGDEERHCFVNVSPKTPEDRKWLALVIEQLRERLPRLRLERGRVIVQFHVDRAGRVSKIAMKEKSSDVLGLLTASTVSALRLPPPASLGRDCCDFTETFFFH